MQDLLDGKLKPTTGEKPKKTRKRRLPVDSEEENESMPRRGRKPRNAPIAEAQTENALDSQEECES